MAGHPLVSEASNISPYLTPGSDRFATKRTGPLADVPQMRCGNKPSDGGNLILTDAERKELLAVEPAAAKFLKRFTGSEEFINGNMRWCLWLKSNYRYSGSMVYNTFPWPMAVTDKQRAAVEATAQAVLDARALYPTSTLADLYDPLTMPAPLFKAHQQLDRAVDRSHRAEPFSSDRHRVEYLFALYEKLTAPRVAAAKPRRRGRRTQGT